MYGLIFEVTDSSTGADFIWEAFQYAQRNESLLFWDRLFRGHGNRTHPHTVEVMAGGRRIIYTADSENIKAILTSQFDDYGKGRWINRDWRSVLGHGVLTTDGPQWHEGRQLLRSQLTRSRLSELHVLENHLNELLELLGATVQGIDVKELFFRLTLDVSTDFLLGRSAGSLRDGRSNALETALSRIQHTLVMIAKSGRLNFLISRRQFRDDTKVLESFIEPYIDMALSLPPEKLTRTAHDEKSTL
ncbi:hypothetical protein LTR28_005892 [Elasticomyces elasticus]|nr:hypothetical protein LTR28_005892 [Elasticomyces elasticus]